MGRTTPLEIFGPEDLLDFIRMAQSSIHMGTAFPTTVYGIGHGHRWEKDDVTITAVEVSHRGQALGYVFEYNRPRGKFLPEKANELGVPKGHLWGKLANGESITLDDGRVIKPEEVSLPPEKGLKIVYSGDTRPCDNMREAAKDADILIHEAMYTEEHSHLSDERGHSTAKQAAEIALDANVRLLVLTHYSPRYENGDQILSEAKEIFPNTIVARDFMELHLTYDGELKVQEPED
jgi:ribonuclease Z